MQLGWQAGVSKINFKIFQIKLQLIIKSWNWPKCNLTLILKYDMKLTDQTQKYNLNISKHEMTKK